MLLLLVIFAWPLWFVLIASISDPAEVWAGNVLLIPKNLTLIAYETLLDYDVIWTGYGNTIFYTVVGTILQLSATLPCAYALSRKDLKGRNLIMTFFIVTMYFSGGMIPGYINVNNMGLVDTRTYMVISGLVSVYNLIVARTFFANTIPWELQEAAYLDGASNFQVFRKIVLPLSAPIIVVATLYYGVGHWSEYFNALIYLKNRNLYPLQMFLKEILTQSQFDMTIMAEGGFTPEQIAEMEAMGETADRMKYAIIVVSAAPMLAIYPWLQKYFAKGMMIGSVKG